MNTEASNRISTAVQEYRIMAETISGQDRKYGNRDRPQWATPLFVTFTRDFNRAGRKVHVPDFQLRCFRCSSTGVVQVQQDCIVALTLSCLSIRCRQKRIHFRFFEIINDRLPGFLEWDRTDLPAPFDMFWTMLSNETGQHTNGGKTFVSRGNPAMTRGFEIGEKQANKIR